MRHATAARAHTRLAHDAHHRLARVPGQRLSLCLACVPDHRLAHRLAHGEPDLEPDLEPHLDGCQPDFQPARAEAPPATPAGRHAREAGVRVRPTAEWGRQDPRRAHAG